MSADNIVRQTKRETNIMATIRHYHAATMTCLTESTDTERTGTLSDMMRDGDAMTNGDTPLRTDYTAHGGYILFNYEGEGYDVVVKCTPEEEVNMLS